MEALKMRPQMNRMFWVVSGSLSIVVIALSIRVYSVENSIHAKPFGIHLKTLRRAAQRIKVGCFRYQDKVKMYAGNSSDTTFLQTVVTIDRIVSFSDSADYFFRRLALLKDNAKEAKKCFDEYGQFSNRFTHVLHLELANTFRGGNYLLKIGERLPAGKLSFDSEQEVQLLALLLEIEFYTSVQDSIGYLVSFCENW
jgi:hypothetical protein